MALASTAVSKLGIINTEYQPHISKRDKKVTIH